MQAIEVSHLIKKFGSLTALNDISFSVGEGETFGFLGPNGAGKTTTIRILTGISRPTSGKATIFGHDIEHDTIASRKSMGIVSENSNVYDDLTAWQNMMFLLNSTMWDDRSEKKKLLSYSLHWGYMTGAMTKRTVFQRE
jgi:ABC-2 type transport system ATP-binding protein